eukprot:GHVU01114111.1.p1 GENE.GHVU01114111.1~~GHVU01114111.1.p1  ORF type:complete len:430 (-),score=54.22 GHVU01114111.1:302-1591(-)
MDTFDEVVLWWQRRQRKKKLLALLAPKHRNAVIKRERIDNEFRTEKMLEQGIFERFLRVNVYQFEIILARIAPSLTVSSYYSTKRTSVPPLQPADMLQLTLAWLRGGPMLDIVWMFQISMAHAYAVAYRVCDAIRYHPDFAIRFPSSPLEIQQSALEFASVCDANVLGTCVAAIDGWACETVAQPISRVASPSAYFSGRYKCYAVCVQLACNVYCQVTAVSVATPGGTNDARAYQLWDLKEEIEALPPGYYVAADAAYPMGPHVQVPFIVTHLDERRRNFNYCLSQMRIRIEMTIGMVTNKFRIFDHASQLDLENLVRVIDTCIRVHNYVIQCSIDEHGRRGKPIQQWLQEQAGADPRDLLTEAMMNPTYGYDEREEDDDDPLHEDADPCERRDPHRYSSAAVRTRRDDGRRLRDDLVALVEAAGVQRP